MRQEIKPNTDRRKFLKEIVGCGVGLTAMVGESGSKIAGFPLVEPLEKDQRESVVVDSHQHFWDPVALKLSPPPQNAAVLGRAFLPAELHQEIVKLGITSTVLVQGYPQTDEANQWLFRQANAAEYVRGVVAWVDLQAPATVARTLEHLRKEPKFVGIRHIVQDEPEVNWIVRDPVLESFKELAHHRVPFDVVVKPDHLKNVLKVLDKVPDLSIVLDHIGKPNIARGGSSGWAEGMTAIARHPQAYCKLSGMVTEADWHEWKPSDLTPFVKHATDVFGWDRVMFGSDWPVCLLAATYQQVWLAIQECLGGISRERWNRVFGINAVRFYGLKL